MLREAISILHNISRLKQIIILEYTEKLNAISQFTSTKIGSI